MIKWLLSKSIIPLFVLGIAAQGCGEMDGAESTETVTAGLVGQKPIVVRGSTGTVIVDQSGPGTAVDTGAVVLGSSVPAQFGTTTSNLIIGVNGGGSVFWAGAFGSVLTSSNKSIAANTNPAIVTMPSGAIGAAFQGANGHVWMTTSGLANIVDTGEVIAFGASPSIVLAPTGVGTTHVSHAFRGASNHMFVGVGGGFATDSGALLAPATNPSIGRTLGGRHVIAFQGGNGHLWITTDFVNNQFFDTGRNMMAGTSPAVAVRTSGGANINATDVAFQGNDGNLWVCENLGDFLCKGGTGNVPFNTGIHLTSTSNPGIVATSSGWQVWGKGSSNNHLWVRMRGQGQQDQNITM